MTRCPSGANQEYEGAVAIAKNTLSQEPPHILPIAGCYKTAGFFVHFKSVCLTPSVAEFYFDIIDILSVR